MLISTRYRFVFLHIPKNGGSALTEVMAPYLDNPVLPRVRQHGWQRRHHCGEMHSTYLEMKQQIPDSFSVCAVWRDVLDRFVSIWKSSMYREMPVEALLKRIRKRGLSTLQRLTWPQSRFVDGCPGVLLWDFDRLQEEVSRFCSDVGLPDLTLNIRNSSKRTSEDREEVLEHREEILDLYREDVFLFKTRLKERRVQ